MSQTTKSADTDGSLGRLNDKVAIVTGARRSLGQAIAVALAAEGARIVVHYFGHRDEAEAIVDNLRSSGADATAVGGDLSDSKAVAALFEQTISQFGGVDIVVANAGVTAPLSPVAGISDELFDSLLNANTRGTFYVLREAARTLRDGGRIINISSSSVASQPPGSPPTQQQIRCPHDDRDPGARVGSAGDHGEFDHGPRRSDTGNAHP